MTPIDTQWLLYSESAIPLWMVLAGLLLCAALAIRWLRKETRRRTLAGRLLPLTLCLLLVLISWRIYQPVLVKVSIWRHEAQRLVYLDNSASMDLPAASERDRSARLDVLAAYDPQAVQGRPHAIRNLGTELQSVAEGAARELAAIQSLHEQVLEGVPLGAETGGIVERYKTWASRSKGGLQPLLAETEAAVTSLSKDQLTPAVAAAALQVHALARDIALLRDDLGDLSANPLAAASASLESFAETAQSLGPHLRRLQAAMDMAFCKEHEAALRPLLSRASGRTRRDVALRVADRFRIAGATVIQADGRRDQTDIHGGLRRLLSQRQSEMISHLIVLSDGGHNCPVDAEVFGDLKKAGVELTAVGIGFAQADDADLAILDWGAPRVVPAQREITLPVLLKTPADVKTPFKLALATEAGVWGAAQGVTTGEPRQTVVLKIKAPEIGRYTVRLGVDAPDHNKRNNEVRFAMDVAQRSPQVLLLGDLPDWDTAYLALASQRAGVTMRQVYPTAQPRRGEGIDAIPDTPSLWGRNQLVILKGAAFKGMTPKDVDDLYKSVSEGGACLMVMVDEHPGYLAALAPAFGWATPRQAAAAVAASATTMPSMAASVAPLKDASVRLCAQAEHLPLTRLGLDAMESSRIFASLGRCEQAFAVPRQSAAILENSQGQPLLSLGFYGRGKVLLWGMKGTSRLRDYGKSNSVDRFLRQLLGHAAASVAVDERDRVAADRGPAAGREGLPLSMEELYYEFNEPFMRQLAADAGGRYVSLAEAESSWPQPAAKTWQSSTSQRYPLADHWLLLAAIAVVGTAHWVLRRLAGLAI